MVQQLSQETLALLQNYVNNGNVAGYYQTLAAHGHEYGNLAYEAATNTGFLGNYANNFLDNKAAEYGITFDRYKLMLDLMEADFKIRKRNNGLPATAKHIADYHKMVFGEHHLPAQAWTGTFFDDRLGPAAWCLSCSDWELQGQDGAGALKGFLDNLVSDWRGTRDELLAFLALHSSTMP